MIPSNPLGFGASLSDSSPSVSGCSPSIGGRGLAFNAQAPIGSDRRRLHAARLLQFTKGSAKLHPAFRCKHLTIDRTGVELLPDPGFVHGIGTDEDDFLAAVAPDGVEIGADGVHEGRPSGLRSVRRK